MVVIGRGSLLPMSTKTTATDGPGNTMSVTMLCGAQQWGAGILHDTADRDAPAPCHLKNAMHERERSQEL
jgi:hypothetical protein